MLNIKSETTKRIIFACILVVVFIPLFIITKYAGEMGRIISAIVYSLIGMYIVFEILVSLKIRKQIAIVTTICVPLFFIFPIEEFLQIIELNKGVNELHLLVKRAISSWQGWVLSLILSFLPLVLESKKYDSNVSYLVKQSIISSIFILIPAFGKLVWISNIKGIEILTFLVLISTISDSGGYFGGKFFGKKWFKGKKLTPKISPKKTYAGFVIGTVLAIIFSILYGYFVHIWRDFKNNELLVSFIFGILLSLISPIGDLYFSNIKRIIQIKDFSNIIPGHGGFMDRLDSISFVFLSFGIFMLFVFN